METSLKKVLIELTKKHKINKSDKFLYSNGEKTYLFEMLSNEFKVDIEEDNLSGNNAIKQISKSEVDIDTFLERFSTIGYRSKDLLNEDETLNPRISVIFNNKLGKVRVHKLSDNQTQVAVTVMNYINQELKQKQKIKASPNSGLR